MQLHRVDSDDGPMSRFSSEFRRALVCRYGRLPSAPFVAREFNLRHDGRRSVSSESVRRWLQGDCLPHIDRLQTISDWLDIRMDSVFLPYQRRDSLGGAGNFPDAPKRVSDWNSLDTSAAIGALSLSEEQRTCLKRLLTGLYPELNLEVLRQALSPSPAQGSLFPQLSGKPR
jgi:hypothetical protein